jgi:vacuolar-type H+-ATPase subunit E/Vma4
MQLIDEFREIGFELSQIVKQEIDKIKENSLKAVNSLEKETNQKIQHDLDLLEQNMIHEAEYRLNKQLSDRINQINKALLERKNQIVLHLIKKSEERLNQRIKENYEAYLDFLLNSLENYAKTLETECWLYLTLQDKQYLQNNAEFIKKFPRFKIHEENINDIAGYKLVAKNGIFELDFTFQTLKEKNYAEIAKTVMNSFPIFEVKLEDAVEIFDHIKGIR